MENKNILERVQLNFNAYPIATKYKKNRRRES